jgi:PAS domain S-box-containing protein
MYNRQLPVGQSLQIQWCSHELGLIVTREALSALASGLDKAGGIAARLLTAFVDASHEFIGIADLQGTAVFVNEAGRRLVGLPDLAAVRSTRIIEYFALEDQPRIIEEVLPAVRNTGYWEGELTFRNFATGRPVPVLYNIFPISNSSGEVIAYGTVTRNLTEARLAEQRLRSLASIVETSDDAIVSKDLDGVIISWNRGAERVFGYSAEEAIGQPITIVIPGDRHAEERDILTRIRRGERIDHYETVRQHKDGSLIVISLTVSPVKDAEGKVIGASKIARDITERKRSQEQIATLAREAEHRSKNLLATVQATVRLSQSDTPEGLKQAIEGRIRALANVHSLFVKTRWIGADLSTIAAQELAPYSVNDRQRVHVDGPPVVLEPNTAQTIAITLHELATNAAKYGALSVAEGRIDLKWSTEADRQLHVRWIETGGPEVQKPTHKGFGAQIIEQMIAQQSGKTCSDWRAGGLVCEITLQL